VVTWLIETLIVLQEVFEENNLQSTLEKTLNAIVDGITDVTNTDLIVPSTTTTKEDVQNIYQLCIKSQTSQEFSYFLSKLRAICFSVGLDQANLGLADVAGKDI
jgi:hypothetical protein